MPFIQYTPEMLARDLQESRDYYAKLGWNKSSCAVGLYDGTIKMACDTGAVDYTFLPDGRISRCAMGVTSPLIVFVETDLAQRIDQHNQAIKDRMLLQQA